MRHIESNIQKSCIEWFRYQHRSLADMIFHIPNGGKRNAREAARLKAEGVTAGVADVILLVGRQGYNSLCIEFKAPKGTQTSLQKEWQRQAETNGNKYIICRSFDEFRDEITKYLKYEL
jgi:hypothetical protein